MQKDSSIQMPKEIQLSLEAVKVRKVSLDGDFNSWNLCANRVPITIWDDSPEPQIYSQMIPFSSHMRVDEPNPFHF
ncbi:MAG: hypothetical protein V1844_12810 [Pseudomonadota bacterium]